MRAATALALTVIVTGGPAFAAPGDAVLAGYVAEYRVRYGSIGVGTSRTELARARTPNLWTLETRLSTSGLGRLVAGSGLLQHTLFQLDDAGLRPLAYRFDDGTRHSGREVTLQFDWYSGRVSGHAEDAPVDIPVVPGLQDSASSQAYVQLALQRGGEPGLVPTIEKNRIKLYQYTLLRRERLETEIGSLETVVYRSARDSSSRENLFWYAPQLGYAIVQAEQRRDGRRLFQTYITAYRPAL